MSPAIVTFLAIGSSSHAVTTAFISLPAQPPTLLAQPPRAAYPACSLPARASSEMLERNLFRRPTHRHQNFAKSSSSLSCDQAGGRCLLSSMSARDRVPRQRFSLSASQGDAADSGKEFPTRFAGNGSVHRREQRAQEPRREGDARIWRQSARASNARLARPYGTGEEDSNGAGTSGTMRPRHSREQELAKRGSATVVPGIGDPAPVEEYDWRQSVFEFRSVNDPRSNLWARSSEQARERNPPPRPVNQPVSSTPKKPFVNHKAPPAGPILDAVVNTADDKTHEWFQFREKEALRRTEIVDENVKGLHGPRAVTTELATQLGLPASASYDEIRKAYRAEIKNCHPDVASVEENEFRARALENRFMRLTTAWEEFVTAHKAASTFSGAEPTAVVEDQQPARSRAPTRIRYSDEGPEETSHQDTRARYVVDDDAADRRKVRSQEVAAAVAAIRSSTSAATRIRSSSRSTQSRYTSDEDGGEFLDTGSSGC